MLLTHTASYSILLTTELYAFSHFLICSLVLPCEVGRASTAISVLPETHGPIAETSTRVDEKEVFVLSTQTTYITWIQMGITDAGER